MIERVLCSAAGSAPARQWLMIAEIDVAPMLALHAEQRQLCDALEHCADALPGPSAVADAAAIVAAIEAGWRSAAAGAVHDLFGALPVACDLRDRLHRYRAADQLHAEDLREALAAASKPGAAARSETLGYMMRCLFDNCRRAADCERLAVLALAGGRLTRAARLALRA